MNTEPLFHSTFENGEWVHAIDTCLTLAEPAKRAHKYPAILETPRELTDAELNDINYIRLEPAVKHYVKCPHGNRFDHVFLSPVEFANIGMLDSLVKARAKILHPSYQPSLHENMSRVRSPKYLAKKKMVYELGISVQKRRGGSSIQLTPISRADDDGKNRELVAQLTRIAHAAIMNYVPGMNDTCREKRKLQYPPLTIGAEENSSITSIQLNFLGQDEGMENLGQFGTSHNDNRDHAAMFSVLFFLGNPDQDHHPGKMILPGQRTVCSTGPCSALIFSGKRWHAGVKPGLYQVDESSPLRYWPPLALPELPAGTPHMRVNAVAYPNARMFDINVMELSDEVFSPAAEAVFETRKKLQDWRMGLYIAREPEIIALAAVKAREAMEPKKNHTKGAGPYKFVELDTTGIERHTDPEYFVDMFSWYDEETLELRRPSRELAVATIAEMGQPNEEWDRLMEDLSSVSCGTWAPGSRLRGKGKMAVRWVESGPAPEMASRLDTEMINGN